MFITRDDIDEAASIVMDCQRQEALLIQKYEMEEKTPCDQKLACPELKKIREMQMKALHFLMKYN